MSSKSQKKIPIPSTYDKKGLLVPLKMTNNLNK